MGITLKILDEPSLQFGYGQLSRDPKEGLFMYGPVRDTVNPLRIRVGLVGTSAGIKLYRKWIERMSKPISAPANSSHSVFFAGFRELFGCEWPNDPDIIVPVSASSVSHNLHLEQRHEAIHSTVGLFCDAINAALREEEARPAFWFVVVPDEVYELGRPNSSVPMLQRVKSEKYMNTRLARKLLNQPSLFESDMRIAIPYYHDLDFHNQLKARLLSSKVVTQVIRESTLILESSPESSHRRMQDTATIAWNLSLSSFYKAGGRPWRLSHVRPGLCYIGLVFKKDKTGPDESWACCAAQMFLTSGDGMVFKGRLGPWFKVDKREFHLTSEQAADIASGAVKAYKNQIGEDPKEVIIHGRTRFDSNEWEGFTSAMPLGTKVVGIRITRSDEFKLYRLGDMPVMRGTTIVESEKLGYLWASGYVPEIGTYPGWETPNPLRIEICQGDEDINVVLSDVFQLTKLNFNSCIYGDGVPVTLRFANAIGEIITAAPNVPDAPLSFKHYI